MLSLLVMLACGSGSNGELTADVTLSDVIATVPTVRWSADDVVDAWVEWGTDDRYGHRVAVDLSTAPDFSTSLLGIAQDTDVHLRVVAETPDGLLESSGQTVTTGFLTGGVPVTVLHEPDADASTVGWLLSSVVMSGAAVLLDDQGLPCWWYKPEGVDMMGRVVLSRDGQRMLMAAVNLANEDSGELITVKLDGTDEQRISMPGLHHDFTELPDGTIAYIAYEDLTDDITGDAIMERAPDGTITKAFDVFDHFSTTSGLAGGGSSWPHANAIDYLPDDDSYLLSMLLLNSIVKVDRASGQPDWVLGGADSTMSTAGGDTDFFLGQHQMHMLEDSLLVFVNGGEGFDSSGPSSAVELSLDPSRNLAEVVWEYWPDPTLSTPILGDVSRLDSGNTLVTFSLNGQVHEVDPQGQIVWMVSMGLGGVLGFTTHYEMLQDDGL